MTEEKDTKIDVEETIEEDETMTPMESFFYHQRRALEETGKALEALLPPDFRKHGAEASREFSTGFKILVDAAIDELKKVSEKEEAANVADDGEGDDKPASTGKNKVKVDVD
jgi:hypothetical protein